MKFKVVEDQLVTLLSHRWLSIEITSRLLSEYDFYSRVAKNSYKLCSYSPLFSPLLSFFLTEIITEFTQVFNNWCSTEMSSILRDLLFDDKNSNLLQCFFLVLLFSCSSRIRLWMVYLRILKLFQIKSSTGY